MAMLIGIDVGGTNLRLGVVEYDEAIYNAQPRLIEEKRFHADFSNLCKSHQGNPEQAWQTILNTTAAAIESVQVKYPKVSAVGIGFPGFIDPKSQKISQSPNLPGLSNVDLSVDLSRMIELPVITENDALAAAYGEYVMHLSQTNGQTSSQANSLIYLGLGTGVGGGLIINGQPFQGQHGVAMEVGHIAVKPNGRLCGCGNRGCMEQYASASGVVISYFEASGEHCNAHEIANRAYKGDANAIAAYSLAGITLAQALAHILKVIDVANVVIGGGMSAGWSLMEPSFTQQLNEDLIPALRGKVNVSISDMGDQAGMIGAAMLAWQKI
ncbi:ROK family protein [Methylotenera sp.]|uniref:ROK family protein n=1 Tax=Methylotenera sp. TaxID=2051956 RepID=UPI00272F6EF0|nr:ROK family protein [Methylotenera sp.]MDP2072169.1 ROK family protein [Methylotenera sp.]MDP2231657.1 ROK family protein [Methylotenera sp.]MDP3006820.1 ROK family protein [Methylotenera sp.]MDP3007243.1 ROK family protein [Methylotenera sp.]MDP3141540.1 ROK family protein [Methylotenera sp.]